jgi:outer membrane biosynthesis protein TonB
MSSEVASAPLGDFVVELFDRARQRRALSTLAWGAAIGGHLLLAGFAVGERRHAPPPPAPLEVELTQPEPPAPPPPPPGPKPEEHAPEPQVAAIAAAPPPMPAHVGALVTAKADPTPSPAHDEPVDFTNDPGALGFGSGVVAIGGRAEVGVKQAALSSAPAAGTSRVVHGPVGDTLTPVGDLSRKPSLGESDPCRGYFPSSAADDVASAAVMVTIGRNGSVSGVQLLSESPPKQGFGSAAKTCMASKHFSPGLTRDGQPTATAIRVNIRFTR